MTNKAILMSVKPSWCDKIASGRKTIEIRKTKPYIILPVKVYIYETKGYERVGNDNLNCIIGGKGRGMVIGEFVCHNIFTIYYDSDIRYGIDYPNEYAKSIMEKSNLTLCEMLDYLNGKDGYAWVISDLKIYDEPKSLGEFSKPCPNGHDCQKCEYYFSEIRDFGIHVPPCCGYWVDEASQIKRPPQSWMFVEELE